MSRSRRGNSDASSSHGSYGHTFPIAHPPPKKSSKAKKSRQCLRLSSRRLLQIQQLQQTSSTTRVIPVLELYCPSSFGKSIPLDHGSRKVHGRDLYLTQSEAYTHLRNRNRSKSNGRSSVHSNGLLTPPTNGYTTKPRSGSGASRSGGSSASGEEGGSGSGSEWKAKFRSRRVRKGSKDSAYASASASGSEENEDEEENDVVAVIHTSPKPRSKKGGEAPPDAELFFPLSGWSWEASSPAPGRYRFRMAGSDDRVVVFEWEKRPPSRSSPGLGSQGTAEKDDGERFVLGVSASGGETTSLKRPWLAQLSRRGIHVGGLEGWQGELGALMIDDGAGLYTLILTMAVWVARAAEWVG